MLLFKYVKNIQYFLLLSFLFITSKAYLVFPLNTLLKKDYSKMDKFFYYNDTEAFLNYYLSNEIYTHIYIGNPLSKIYMFFDFENYESYLDNSICPFPSKYNNDTSSSFLSTSDYIVAFSHFSNMCFAKETFYAFTDINLDEKKLKKLENLTFLYATEPKNDSLFFKFNPNMKLTGNSCFHLGMQLPISTNYYESLVQQLKKNDFIETTYWTIDFKNKEQNSLIENDSYLIIGVPPHKYNPEKYNEKSFRSVASQLRIKNYQDYRVNIWGFIFDKIFFKTNNESFKNNEIILQSSKCKIDFGINLIEGSNNYLTNIENEFFNHLYSNKICFKEKASEENHGIYFVIWCNTSHYEEIKKFPSLYFKSNELEYIFELNFEDLFMIKEDKLFFLIIFRKSQGIFSLGKLFFKKYLFTFSFDNKIIGFYNEKILTNSEIVNNKNSDSYNNKGFKKKIVLFLFCFAFVFVILIIFFKIKKKYLNERQKRMNELIDNNYVYMTNQIKENDAINNKFVGI